MKFFTPEWWKSAAGEDFSAHEKYAAYLESVKTLLPAGLLELQAKHTLHDSEVKSLVSDFNERTVVMVLHGWDSPLETPVRYALRFSDVSYFEQILPQQEYVESELGDLGYWECELLDAAVEVRMLFASYAEFRIAFKGFSFEHVRRET